MVYTYLHLPSKSAIHVGKIYINLLFSMDPMGVNPQKVFKGWSFAPSVMPVEVVFLPGRVIYMIYGFRTFSRDEKGRLGATNIYGCNVVTCITIEEWLKCYGPK